MAQPDDLQQTGLEDDYDEEADSDFNGDGSNDDLVSASSDDDAERGSHTKSRTKLNKPTDEAANTAEEELDSGDEATIKEQQRAKKKQKRKGEDVDGNSDSETGEWRAKTRAMRAQDTEEKKRNKLASSKGSTIDVDKIWEAMNKPGPLPPVRMEDGNGNVVADSNFQTQDTEENKENIPTNHGEEMITIKRKFHFAGEVHEEEKTVPRSSAEARLWLSQQDKMDTPETAEQQLVQRPLRKVSRFDPNHHNLAAFKTNFVRPSASDGTFKGPKLNVVEKSKMDWAAHVDAEGLKDELDIHAKAKEGYHGRMDFLNQVEQRKEEDARLARMQK